MNTKTITASSIGICGAGICYSAGCFALADIALSGPVGVSKSAIYGAISGLAAIPISLIEDNDTSKTISLVASLAIATATFFAVTVVSWGASAALGVKMSFKTALILSAASSGISIVTTAATMLIAATVFCVYFPDAINLLLSHSLKSGHKTGVK